MSDYAINWYCRTNKQPVPSSQQDEYTEYKKAALLYLYTEVRDGEGYTVLQLAALLSVTGKQFSLSYYRLQILGVPIYQGPSALMRKDTRTHP